MRLTNERKNWRENHPVGFFARLKKAEDGSQSACFEGPTPRGGGRASAPAPPRPRPRPSNPPSSRPARPPTLADLMVWECGIPGRAGTPWEGGTYRIELTFSLEYPSKPPKCTFKPPLFHPNVYPSGNVCLSILDEAKDWVPTITVVDILRGIQDLLSEPNLSDPAQREAFIMARDRPEEYMRRVKLLAKAYEAA
jgi:ubiquitin-conjugating enzyme E2 I